VCALAQDPCKEQDFTELAPEWFYLPLEHLKNPRKKCSPGNPAPKSTRVSKVWLLLYVILITAGAPENPENMLSVKSYAKVHTDKLHF
jgi:hypothetical protein